MSVPRRPSVAGRSVTRQLTRALRVLVLVIVLGVMTVHILSPLMGPAPRLDDMVFAITTGGSFLAVGAIILLKAGWHRVGWLLLGIGVLFAVAETDSPFLPEWFGSWIAVWVWLAAFTLMASLTMVFPSGHLPSRPGRWPVASRLLLAVMVVLVLAMALVREGAGSAAGEPIPFGVLPPVVATFAPVGVIAGLLAGAVSLLVRLRHSGGEERLQLRWVAASLSLIAVVVGLTITILVVVDLVGQPYPGDEIWGPAAISFVSLPVAFLVAIMKFRLFEIDRVISRTVTYAVVVGVLAVVFIGGVLVLRSLFPAQGDLGVAASTLAVAALFSPLRRRIQVGVDRRFNRSRYDAQRELDRFAGRLRDELDLDGVTRDLLGVVGSALQPSTASLWIRPDTGGPR